MKEDKTSLEKLKEKYKEIKKKHGLPSFEDLNKDFGIEKIAEYETDFLIREVRKYIGERSSNYLRFLETILNPVNAPMFVFSFIKLIGSDEKKRLTEIYKELIKEEIKVLELDMEFSEEKEAKFIREYFVFWQKIKKEMLELLVKVNGNWDNKSEGNSKGYFG
ncbi:MAG: hypothetical protein Q8P15_02395 [Nanoarchaeota archaeon]|nr:hypothetical protein [Nanoarchaeota archaeon]